MYDLWALKNAKIVTETGIVEGSISIDGGLIHRLDEGPLTLGEAEDCEGDYLIAGLVDVHTDNLERHLLPRKSADWPVLAALLSHDAQLACAGATTVLDALCVGTAGLGVRHFSKVEAAIAGIAAGKAEGMFRSEHLLHLRAELSNPEMPSMFARVFENPEVRLVSLMDHTPGQRQWADMERYIAMEKKDFKLTEEEIAEFVRTCREKHEKFSEPNRAAVLAMLADSGIVLASHDDTTLEHVEQAAAEGIAISEFPTTFVAAEAARAKAMYIVAGAPNLVLGRSHSGNVSATDLARRGLVDVLSSDYVPSSLLHGAFLLTEEIGVPLHEAMKTVTSRPARMVGLEDRGAIAPGLRADLLRVRCVQGVPLIGTVWRGGVRVV